MSDPPFAVFDIGLPFAIGLGLAVWQLVLVRRSMSADRDAEAAATGDDGRRTADRSLAYHRRRGTGQAD